MLLFVDFTSDDSAVKYGVLLQMEISAQTLQNQENGLDEF